MLEEALAYLAKGLSVVPVVPRGKNPLIPWKEFQNRLATEEEVKEWFTKWPDSNIGIITGKISGITVVDVEKDGKFNSPPTLIAKTGGGGFHYYFKYAPEVDNFARIQPLIDIRGNSGLVVAAPSIHPSGEKYEWVLAENLAEFPYDYFGFRNNNWDEIIEGVEKGSRNESAAKYIGLRVRRFPEKEWESFVWPDVKQWNERNNPPLSEKELRTTFKSICQRQRENQEKEANVAEEYKSKIEYLTFTDVLEKSCKELQETKPEDVISFGYDFLDEKLTGIFPGELVILGGETGCFAKGTLVRMSDHTLKKIEDILPGDKLLGPDFKPRTVQRLFHGREEMYKVTSDFFDFTVNASHTFALQNSQGEYFEKKCTDFIYDKAKTIRAFYDQLDFHNNHKLFKTNGESSIFSVTPIGRDNFYGFELDLDHLFCLEDYTVQRNSGKTTAATNILYKASRRNRRCTLFALEDRLEDYGIKALYFELGKVIKDQCGPDTANYSWNSYRTNSIDDGNFPILLDIAKNNLKNELIEFVKADTIMTIDLLEMAVEDCMKRGTELFLIDHLHYFNLFHEKKSKADFIEEIMVRIRTLQRKTGARIIMIVHYRKLNGDKKPNLDSFKDSISIVQNANYVINLWRDRTPGAEQYETYFFLPKSRNPQGEGLIKALFDPQTNDYIALEEWSFG